VVVVLLVQVGLAAGVGLSLLVVAPRAAVLPAGYGLLGLIALLLFLLRWQRDDHRRAALLATGTRAPAVLVASRATRVRLRHHTVLAHTFQARAGDIRAEARSTTHLPVGTRATIAYDPADPAAATVVELG
jgi:hypothetical protein